MKRILLLITKGEIGGATQIVADLAKGLAKRGFFVTVGCGEGEYLDQELGKEGIPVIRFERLKRSRNPLKNLLFYREIRRYLDQHEFDAVHIHSSNALIAGRAAKVSRTKPKTLFTFHGMSFLHPAHGSALGRSMYAAVFKYLLRFIDIPVFVCRSDYEHARSLGLFARGEIIPNGISPIRFRLRDDARGILSRMAKTDLSSKIIIGSIGRLAYPKNYELLIRIASRMKNKEERIAFVILGEGPERKRYERLIGKTGTGGMFFLPGEAAHAGELLPAFDIFALASLYEGTPLTLLEALQAGLPAAVPAVGGIPEVLGNDRNQLFEGNNETECETKLAALVGNMQLRMSEGRNNKARSASYSAERMVEAYERILK